MALKFVAASSQWLKPNNQSASNLAPSIITLSAWVNPASSASTLKGVIEIRSNAGANYNAILGTFTSNEASFFYANTTNITASALSLNTWSHICGTVDSNGSVLYVNGTSVATGAGATLTNSISEIRIGDESGNAFFDGSIADAAIWNVKLTAGEVSALANGARPYQIRPLALQAWWPLDGIVSTEPDLSGFANNAPQQNGPISTVLGPPFMMQTPRIPMIYPAVVGGGGGPSFKPAWSRQKNIIIEGFAT